MARATFNLEQQFTKIPELARQEEIISRLNQLRVGIVRKKMADLRVTLREAEAHRDDAEQLAVLQKLSQHETELKKDAFDITLFQATSL